VVVPGGFDPTGIIVFVNGVATSPPDISVTSGTSIGFNAPLTAGDEVSWVAFGVFQVADAATKAEFDTLNAEVLGASLNVQRYGAKGDGVTDDTAAFLAAITAAPASYGAEIVVPPGIYKITAPIDLRNRVGIVFRGMGLPQIVQATPNTPIVLMGGERNKITGLMLQFASPPLTTDTDAVAIRCYNLYESIIERLYLYRVHTGIDQFQGLVNGGQNAFFSNAVRDIRIVYFKGWGMKLVPYSGGNSGNRLDNIYINNRSGANASDSIACSGGLWLQTSDDGVFNQINIEWMRNASPAIVLNQAGNPVFNGVHFEGLYPTTNFNPLIDILGGDGSTPVFNGLTVVGCDWGGATGMGLFRLDNQGTYLRVAGLRSRNNVNLGGMTGLLINAGSTCYGSIMEVDSAACDGSFQNSAYSPKASYGSAVSGKEIPIQKYNLYRPKHTASILDNAGGTQSSGAMSGSVSSASFDAMGLWDSANGRFNIKHTGTYNVSVAIPTGSSPVVYVQKNFSNVATLTLGATGGSASVPVQLVAGDNVEFYLASGSYTRTNVVMSISL
jgi:hypothetical protein